MLGAVSVVITFPAYAGILMVRQKSTPIIGNKKKYCWVLEG